jgi:hypothetical protein
MHTKTVLSAFALIFVGAFQILAGAQDTAGPGKTPSRQFNAYHLDLSVIELADGKKVNSRHYSMNVATQNGNGFQQLKIGSRVAVNSGPDKLEYIEVGTSINVQMGPSFFEPGGTGPSTINVNAVISSFAKPEQAEMGHPLIRQVQLSGSSPIVLDKPMIVASADDPESKREFQLTVTATKLAP